MTCKNDCIHYDACIDMLKNVGIHGFEGNGENAENICEQFCNRGDYEKVVHCIDCMYCKPLDRNCELNSTTYKHCSVWRGEETKHVWHKYKKYYKDYSIVEYDGYCSHGEKKI